MTATARPRILFVINSLAGGGAERVMLSLIARSEPLRDRYEIALALLDDEPRDYAPSPWLTVHQLDARRGLARSTLQLLRLARRERPALTLSFLTRSNIASVAVARTLRHRAIVSERAFTSGHFAPGIAGRIAKRLIRLAYPRADHLIAVSDDMAADLVARYGLPRARVTTIANPVDGDAIRRQGAESATPPVAGRYAVVVARQTRGKNVGLVVEALAASGLDLSLVLLGQGPERDAIRARADALGLGARVAMPGFVANPYPLVRQAACYVSASNGEGFPNGLVEALALGVPAVVTNCASGPAEILAERGRAGIAGLTRARYGILVPQNDVAAMAEGLRLAADPDTARRYAEAGPARAADFSPERATAAYWRAIEDCLQPARLNGRSTSAI